MNRANKQKHWQNIDFKLEPKKMSEYLNNLYSCILFVQALVILQITESQNTS